MRTISRPDHLASGPVPRRRDAFGVSGPVLLWAVVVALTFLSFYVHLLNEQMARARVPQAVPHGVPEGVPNAVPQTGAAQAKAVQRATRAEPAAAQAERLATAR